MAANSWMQTPAETGRQPWFSMASCEPPIQYHPYRLTVLTSLVLFIAVYGVLLVGF